MNQKAMLWIAFLILSLLTITEREKEKKKFTNIANILYGTKCLILIGIKLHQHERIMLTSYAEHFGLLMCMLVPVSKFPLEISVFRQTIEKKKKIKIMHRMLSACFIENSSRTTTMKKCLDFSLFNCPFPFGTKKQTEEKSVVHFRKKKEFIKFICGSTDGLSFRRWMMNFLSFHLICGRRYGPLI